jgi:CheY-like chemotaxis protein
MKQILYIEDCKASQWVMQKKLAQLGAMTVASSLAAGRAVLSGRSFDLIIADWFLPDGKATELLQEIRARHTALEVPVILVSASMDRLLFRQALQLGANECFSKPIRWGEFVPAVTSMLVSPSINPLAQTGVLVTWVEGCVNQEHWLYCPEADMLFKGKDAAALKRDAARQVLERMREQPLQTVGSALEPRVSQSFLECDWVGESQELNLV